MCMHITITTTAATTTTKGIMVKLSGMFREMLN